MTILLLVKENTKNLINKQYFFKDALKASLGGKHGEYTETGYL